MREGGREREREGERGREREGERERERERERDYWLSEDTCVQLYSSLVIFNYTCDS